MQLAGRVAIVTGASAGIGRALALALARAGCDVALLARRIPDLEELAVEIRSAGRGAWVLPVDLRDQAAVERLGPAVEHEMGRVDILVNCAGIGLHAPVVEAAPADVRHLFELNVLAPVTAIRSVVPSMRRQGGGMIVNIASMAGLIAVPKIALYCASKFALRAVSDAVRVELAPDRIRVLAVYPGSIATDFSAHMLGRRTRPAHRIGKAGSPEGLAARVVRAMVRDERAVIYPAWYRPLWYAAGLAPRLRDLALAAQQRRAQKRRPGGPA